jgi:hypothetical protein
MSESDMRDRKKTPDVAGAHPGYATVSTKRKSEIFFAARLDTSGKSVPPQIVGRIRYVARMSECDMRERKKPRMSLSLIRATPLTECSPHERKRHAGPEKDPGCRWRSSGLLLMIIEPVVRR